MYHRSERREVFFRACKSFIEKNHGTQREGKIWCLQAKKDDLVISHRISQSYTAVERTIFLHVAVQSVAKPRKKPRGFHRVYKVHHTPRRYNVHSGHLRWEDATFPPVLSYRRDPRRIRRGSPPREGPPLHISRSKSTMGFEAGQRMRAISVYSGRVVIYNGGEAET